MWGMRERKREGEGGGGERKREREFSRLLYVQLSIFVKLHVPINDFDHLRSRTRL